MKAPVAEVIIYHPVWLLSLEAQYILQQQRTHDSRQCEQWSSLLVGRARQAQYSDYCKSICAKTQACWQDS